MKHLLWGLMLFSHLALSQITATSWLIARESGDILTAQNIDQIRPIASITKLMTVMVDLDKKNDLAQMITIKRMPKISTHISKQIKSLSREDLMGLALISSDNLAAYLLCANYNGIYDASLPCLPAMNLKATTIGMVSTTFTDPTGLQETNTSTARDLIKLVQEASKYQIILENSDKRNITIKLSKNKQETFNNTNSLIGKNRNILVSKTGWIKASGGCLVILVRADLANRIVIVLGSKTTKTRILEAEIISELPDREDQDWIYKYLRIER